jgi:hypothetical protein
MSHRLLGCDGETANAGRAGVGGLLGWVWESPEVAAFEGERFACLW